MYYEREEMNESAFMRFVTNNSRLIFASFAIITILILVAMVAFTSTRSNKEYVSADKIEGSARMTPQEGFAAIFRTTVADQACFDNNSNSFIIHYGNDVNDAEWQDEWALLEDDEYQQLSNGTWIMKEAGHIKKIHPLTQGLTCANAKDYANK